MTEPTMPVGGGAEYPIRSWTDAWAQVKAGHYYAYAGPGLLANGAPLTQLPPFGVDSIQLVYWQRQDVHQQYLVPMWAFHSIQLSSDIYYPAVTDQYLNWRRP